MYGKNLFYYLQGKWLIKREIINKLLPLESGDGVGEATIIKTEPHILAYNEELKIAWKNGHAGDVHKKYLYILDIEGNLKLYDNLSNRISYMYSIIYNTKITKKVEGKYQCLNDNYRAIYEFIDNNKFTLTFHVKGANKNYCIRSFLVRQ